MAPATITMSRAKTKNAATTTVTEIDQQQSLQLLQILIHGGLSSVFFARNFFPEHAFDEQRYQCSDKFHSYEDYAAGKIPEDPKVAESDTAVVRVLRRDRSSRVNKFLDCLEKGAFSALQELNLKVLQVYVHPVHDRKKVIETYTFTISYSSNRSGNGRVISGLEIEGPDNRRSTIGMTITSMVYLFRIIAEICDGLPTLIGNGQDDQGEGHEVFISMKLFYEDGKPKNGHPTMFERDEGGPIFFGEAEDWEMRAESISSLAFGSQTAAMQITHLQHKSVAFTPNIVDWTDPQMIPRNLEFMKARDPFDKLKRIRYWHARRQASSSERERLNIIDTRTQSTIVEDQETLSTLGESAEAEDFANLSTSRASPASLVGGEERELEAQTTSMSLPDFQGTDGFGLSDSLDTQSSNVPAMKKIRKMMQPERMTQGDTQMQDLSSQPASESTASPTKSVGRTEYQPSDVVNCQCGSEKEDDAMLECHACNTLQHCHCYGYRGAADDRMPADYKCYQCLLGNDEPERLEVLRELLLNRRAMYVAEKDGLTNQNDFVAKMRPKSKAGTTRGPTTTVARSLYQFLKDKGYVLQAGTGKLVAVDSGPGYDEMMKDLFDPFKEINHHFDMSAGFEASNIKGLAQSVLATQVGLMPPPMTPASHYRRQPTTTPRTDLDRGVHAPDLRTPSRPPSSQHQRPKRDLADTTLGLPVKRHAGYDPMRSQSPSQTSFLFNASGVPSSPAASSPGDDRTCF